MRYKDRTRVKGREIKVKYDIDRAKCVVQTYKSIKMHVMQQQFSLSLHTLTHTHYLYLSPSLSISHFLFSACWRVPNSHFIMTSKVIYFDSVCHMQLSLSLSFSLCLHVSLCLMQPHTLTTLQQFQYQRAKHCKNLQNCTLIYNKIFQNRPSQQF